MPTKLFNKITQSRESSRPARKIIVEIYSKPGCHLCDEAKATLNKMQRRFGFDLREVNVAAEEALLTKYGTRIPLIFVNGHLVCKYFVDETAMLKKISSWQ